MISTAKTTCFVLVLIAVHACTVQKRLYRKGWHMEWKQRSTSGDAQAESNYLSDQVQNEQPESPVPAEAEIYQADHTDNELIAAAEQQPVPDEDSLLVEENKPYRRIVTERKCAITIC